MKTKILLAVLLGTTFTGCASFYECVDDNTMGARNYMLARQAWHRWHWCYADVSCCSHFARGFRDGYVDAINGVPECQPVLPPRKYWGACYQSTNGHCEINSWYNGYSHGHLAATKDGLAEMGRIPISPTARQNMLQAEASAHLRKSYYARRQAEGSTIRAPYFGDGSGIRTDRPDNGVDTEVDEPSDGGLDEEIRNLRDALDGQDGGNGTRPYEDAPTPSDDSAAMPQFHDPSVPLRQANVPHNTQYLPESGVVR